MEELRAYGDVFGLSRENFEKIKHGLPFNEVEYADGKLRLDHEGRYFDLEPVLDELAELIDEDGWAAFDFIDHLEWTLKRYTLEKGKWTVKEVDPNAVLDPIKDNIGA